MLSKEYKLHRIFMKTAMLMSEMSNCVSYKVGAILVKDGRIISTGYNGTPAGYINCCEKFTDYSINQRENHHKFSETFEIHAELNAILSAAKNGLSTDGCTLYCTLQPCNDCLKMICNTGIKTIYYNKAYDKSLMSNEVNDMLNKCNVKLIQLTDGELK
jgi:dCMP deaminase